MRAIGSIAPACVQIEIVTEGSDPNTAAMNFTKNIGMLLLAIFLIVTGIISLFPALGIPPILAGILALVAGIFILIGK